MDQGSSALGKTFARVSHCLHRSGTRIEEIMSSAVNWVRAGRGDGGGGRAKGDRNDGVSGGLNGSQLTMGAIKYPEQLKPHSGRINPRYVVAVGSVPCERSTIDMAPHNDFESLLPCDPSLCESVYLRPPEGDAGCAGREDAWFPSVLCSSADADGAASCKTMIHYRGYGQPWYLVGDSLPSAQTFQCCRAPPSPEDPNDDAWRWRFRRPGGEVTVVKLTEEDEEELEYMQNLYGARPDLFTLILFEYKKVNYRIQEDSFVAVMNGRLSRDPRWLELLKYIRETKDPNFGADDEYATTLFDLDPLFGVLTRTGMAFAYNGLRDEDIDCAIVDIVSCNYMGACFHYAGDYDASCKISGRIGEKAFVQLALDGNTTQRRRSAQSSYGGKRDSSYRDESLPAVDDPYGWERASEGPGLGLAPGEEYAVTVAPPLELKRGTDIGPVYKFTRETAKHLKIHTGLGGLVKRSASLRGAKTKDGAPKKGKSAASDVKTPAGGCHGDADEAFTWALSIKLAADWTWLRSHKSNFSPILRFGPKCAMQGLPRASEEPAVSGVSWFLRNLGGWVCRRDGAPRKSALARGPDQNAKAGSTQTLPARLSQVVDSKTPTSSKKPADRAGKRGRPPVDLSMQNRVAVSSMGGWNARTCQTEAVCRINRNHRVARRRGPHGLFNLRFLDANERAERRELERSGGVDETSFGRPLEHCLMVFVGASMLPAMKHYLCLDEKNAKVLFEELGHTVKSLCVAEANVKEICEYPGGTKPKFPFAFVVAAVSADVRTGARTCFRVEMGVCGITTRPAAVYSAACHLRRACHEVSVAGVYNLSTVEAVPEISFTPYRCVLQFVPGVSDCAMPTMVRCSHYCVLPLHCEEARVLGSASEWRVPDQKSYCRALASSGSSPPKGAWCLGFFFPVRGFRSLSTEGKRRFGEYCQRLRTWLQWGQGAPHFGALRRLVPLCDCYLADVGMTNNYFGYGLLLHLHCRPEPERERTIAAVMAAALSDAQKYPFSSLFVDVKLM